MPLWKCVSCHHEWEGTAQDCMCDWCTAGGMVIDLQTPLERMLEDMYEDPQGERPALSETQWASLAARLFRQRSTK